MMWPSQLVIMRHGEADGTNKTVEEIRAAGSANQRFPLTEFGRQQALVAGEYVRERFGSFDAVFTSSFLRAQETAGLLKLDREAVIDVRVDEWWRGIWYVLTNEEIRNRYPEEFLIRQTLGWFHYRPIGGESAQDVEMRIHSFAAYLREAYAGKKVLVVGHGNWQLLFWRIMTNATVAEAEKVYQTSRFENTSIALYEDHGRSLELVENRIVPWQGKIFR